MPMIEISEETAALLKAAAAKDTELMTRSAGYPFEVTAEEIADNLLRGGLANMLRGPVSELEEDIPF